MIQSILFLRHDRIGDMVLSTAAIKALRKAFPKAHLTVLASERNREILDYNPHVNEILIYKGIQPLLKDVRPRHYDLIIDPFLTYELKQALMTYLAGGRHRIGFEVAGREVFFNLRGPTPSRPQRMVNHLLDLIEHVGADAEGCVPEVYLSEAEVRRATKALAQGGRSTKEFIVALHPGAYYPSQRWPSWRFGELALRLLARYEVHIIVLGSQDEEALLRDMQKIVGNRAQFFFGLKLRELMALISQCDLLICNNSGPLHIASAFKIPTVSMIGPTITPLWLPYGKGNVVINKTLSCSPCNRAICKGHQCMSLITVDEVFEAVQTQITAMGLKHRAPSTLHKRNRKTKKSCKQEKK